MKSNYSLVFYRYKISNRINVGLIIWNKNKSKVYFKLNPTNNPFANDNFQSLRKYLRDLDVSKLNEEITRIHKTNNGVIGIDKPTQINIELTNDNFDKLFNKFI